MLHQLGNHMSRTCKWQRSAIGQGTGQHTNTEQFDCSGTKGIFLVTLRLIPTFTEQPIGMQCTLSDRHCFTCNTVQSLGIATTRQTRSPCRGLGKLAAAAVYH